MTTYARSSELMNHQDTVLVVVDMQEKLLPAVQNARRVQWNVRRLLDAATVFEIPVMATEQYPRGLGTTPAELRDRLGEVVEKLTFSSMPAEAFRAELHRIGPRNVVLAGIETHVCVQQTALDLIAEGYRVFLPADAVSSRYETDYAMALRRMETSGVTLATTESVMFEWCFEAGTEIFRKIRDLVAEKEPAG